MGIRPLPLARLLLALLCAAGAAAPVAAGTWTVDDDGGADFPGIAAAIAASAPGDLLLVAPGDYGPFELTHQLSIVGFGGTPSVSGLSTVRSDTGAVLSKLVFQRLHVLDCPGTVMLDHVDVIDRDGLGCPTFLIEGCHLVFSNHGNFLGMDGDGTCESEGVVVRASTLYINGGYVEGGRGSSQPLAGHDGQPALRIEDGATTQLTHVPGYAGRGGAATAPGGTGGDGAPALVIEAGSVCRVAGHDKSPLSGSSGGAGTTPGSSSPWVAGGTGELVVSGVPLLPPAFAPGLGVTQPDPPHAFIENIPLPTGAPGWRIFLYGPPGQSHVLLGSLVAAELSLPALVEGTLLLDPTSTFVLLPLVSISLEQPVFLDLSVPDNPAWYGLIATFQAFSQQAGPPAWRATNPLHIVVP